MRKLIREAKWGSAICLQYSRAEGAWSNGNFHLGCRSCTSQRRKQARVLQSGAPRREEFLRRLSAIFSFSRRKRRVESVAFKAKLLRVFRNTRIDPVVRRGAVEFYIDKHSSVPVIAQIKEQIKLAVAMGIFRNGDKLPSIREVEKQTGVNCGKIKLLRNPRTMLVGLQLSLASLEAARILAGVII